MLLLVVYRHYKLVWGDTWPVHVDDKCSSKNKMCNACYQLINKDAHNYKRERKGFKYQ